MLSCVIKKFIFFWHDSVELKSLSRERKKQEFDPAWLHTLIAALHAAANITLNSATVGF